MSTQQRNDITRISELPEASSTQYQPMNIHQNPYGIPEPTNRQLPTISVSEMKKNGNTVDMGFDMGFGAMGGMGGFSGEGMPPPPPHMMNRGIPSNPESFQQDEQIVPNYIPKPKLTTDYLREYEDKLSSLTEEHRRAKHQESLITSLYDEIQVPVLIGMMFFLFQMPFISAMMFKYLAFLHIYNEDGNLNLYGITLKSFLFGLFYFAFIRITTYLA